MILARRFSNWHFIARCTHDFSQHRRRTTPLHIQLPCNIDSQDTIPPTTTPYQAIHSLESTNTMNSEGNSSAGKGHIQDPYARRSMEREMAYSTVNLNTTGRGNNETFATQSTNEETHLRGGYTDCFMCECGDCGAGCCWSARIHWRSGSEWRYGFCSLSDLLLCLWQRDFLSRMRFLVHLNIPNKSMRWSLYINERWLESRIKAPHHIINLFAYQEPFP